MKASHLSFKNALNANKGSAVPFRISIVEAMRNPLRKLRANSPRINFITLHYAYFLSTCLVSAVIFWGSSTPPRSVSFTDSLFVCVSAMTLAGLNTVNLSELNTFQQFLLFLLIIIGSAILVSSVVVHVRKKAFEKRFAHIIEQERERRKTLKAQISRSLLPFARKRTGTSNLPEPEVDGIVVRGRAIPVSQASNLELLDSANPGDRPPAERTGRASTNSDLGTEGKLDTDAEPNQISTAPLRQRDLDRQETPHSTQVRFADTSPVLQRHKPVFSMSGVGARPTVSSHPRLAHSSNYAIPLAALTDEKGEPPRGTAKYFKSGGFIGRNSQFHSLSAAERDRLGGVEYRGLRFLEIIVPVYLVLFQLLGCIGLGAWVAINQADTTLQNGLNPWQVVLSNRARISLTSRPPGG